MKWAKDERSLKLWKFYSGYWEYVVSFLMETKKAREQLQDINKVLKVEL